MRITCDVETTNRVCATLNMRGKGKVVRAQVSIGKKLAPTGTESEVFIMICTKQDRNGTKYKVSLLNSGIRLIRTVAPSVDQIIFEWLLIDIIA